MGQRRAKSRCMLIVYNLTHVIGTVEQSVEQDLPLCFQVTYWALVTLWVTSFVRVLLTRKPHRCRHCTKCSACVLRMDHHCPWLRQCIGFANYKYFVNFIVYSALALAFKAVTMLLFMIKAFQMDTSFCTRLWLLSTEVLIIALGGTMLLFSGHTLCHRRRLEQNPDMFKKNEKSDKKIVFDQGLVGNVQSALGSNPLSWFLPACPPSGDGCTFPYMVLCQEDVKAFNGARGVYHASFWKRQMRQATKRDLAVSEMSESDDQRRSLAGSMGVVKQKNPVTKVASYRASTSQPCLESTAEPTCIEQQQDGCVAADTAGEDHLDDV